MKKTQTKTDNIAPDIDVRINKCFDKGNCRAIASATLYGSFAVRNIRLMEGNSGMFLSFPSYKDKQGEYHDVCFPVTAELRQRLTETVVAAYDRKQTLEQESPAQEQEPAESEHPARGMEMTM